jgi:hypothetical protein
MVGNRGAEPRDWWPFPEPSEAERERWRLSIARRLADIRRWQDSF